MTDEFWMKRALLLARKALKLNKIPIASVLVYKNSEIGYSFNYAEFFIYPYHHSEIISFKQGSFYISNFLLNDVIMYVILESCSLCLSFAFLFRIKKVIFGAYSNQKHKISKHIKNAFFIKGGILKDESSFLLKKFFSKNR